MAFSNYKRKNPQPARAIYYDGSDSSIDNVLATIPNPPFQTDAYYLQLEKRLLVRADGGLQSVRPDSYILKKGDEYEIMSGKEFREVYKVSPHENKS